jgi:hypothetical protein
VSLSVTSSRFLTLWHWRIRALAVCRNVPKT